MSDRPITQRDAASFAFFDLLIAIGRECYPYNPNEAPAHRRETPDDLGRSSGDAPK